MRHPWGERNSRSGRGQARAGSPGKAEGLTEGATETHPRAPGEPAQGPQEAQSRRRAQPVLAATQQKAAVPSLGDQDPKLRGRRKTQLLFKCPQTSSGLLVCLFYVLWTLWGGPVRPLEHFSAKECSFRNAYSKIILGIIKKLIIMNAIKMLFLLSKW